MRILNEVMNQNYNNNDLYICSCICLYQKTLYFHIALRYCLLSSYSNLKNFSQFFQNMSSDNKLNFFLIQDDLTSSFLKDSMGFPGGSDGLKKKIACNDRKIPRRMEQLPIPVFLPGKSHGQRNLVGYSSQGRKGSDMTD